MVRISQYLLVFGLFYGALSIMETNVETTITTVGPLNSNTNNESTNKITTNNDNNKNSNNDDCICNPDRTRRLGLYRRRLTVNITNVSIITTTQIDSSNDDKCPCNYTTTSKPIPSCQDGYQAGNKCTTHDECNIIEFCNTFIGGYCCLELVDNRLRSKSFTQKMAYYYQNNTGIFVAIIFGLSLGIFGLLCFIAFLIHKLRNKNKYTKVDNNNNNNNNDRNSIDVTRISISKNNDKNDKNDKKNNKKKRSVEVTVDDDSSDDIDLDHLNDETNIITQDPPDTPSDRNM